jgi:hypothetical protein
MKNFSRFSILAVALMTLAGSALAVDFTTNAEVEIVEGIDIVENTALNFGVLAARDGSIVVDQNSTYTDNNWMMYDNSSVAAANFSITSAYGANLSASAVAGGSPPAGFTISAFTFQWDNTGSGADHDIAEDSATATLEVGATLDYDASTGNGAIGAGVTNIPYDLTVVFQ